MTREESTFSELTLIEAVNLYRNLTQAKFEQQMLYLSLSSETLPRGGLSVENKANLLTSFVIENPSHQTAEGEDLNVGIIKGTTVVPKQYSRSVLQRALARDGYTLNKDGLLIRDLPPIADLPEANDELFSLLDELSFPVAKGHLDQAIKTHAAGQWASANAQLRTFLEEVFNEISKRLDAEQGDKQLTSHQRRSRLAQIVPPFLEKSLGEWDDNSVDLVHGLFRRLNPEGSHPGLSDDEDCTFRLHMILIIGRHYLRRYKNRLSQI